MRATLRGFYSKDVPELETWLTEHPPPKNFEFLRGSILLSRWDYATLGRALTDLGTHAEGNDWPEIAVKLSRSRQ